MKIVLYLAVWQRPEITEICFMGLQRLMKRTDFEVSAFAVISEESMIPLCEKYGVDYCMFNNFPLGEKKNNGLNEVMKRDFDYLIELGSDDLIKDEVLVAYKPYFGVRDFLSLTSVCFIDSETGNCKATEPRTFFGLGRAISKAGLHKAAIRKDGKYRLWRSYLNKGLDNDSAFRLAFSGVLEKRVRTTDPIVIDIKSAVNIHGFDKIEGFDYPLEKALEGLSENEINAIQCLTTKNKSASLISA